MKAIKIATGLIMCINSIYCFCDILNSKAVTFITMDNLEKIGFEHLSSSDFLILFKNETYYILNKKDYMIAKFKGETPQKKYKEKGQGPGGFIDPRSLFFYNPETLAIFDITKFRVLLFDLDINFLKEIRVSTNTTKMQDAENGYVSYGDFGDKLFSVLDSDFKTTDTFQNANRTTPFKDLYPQLLNRGYLLMKNKVSYTSWLYTYRSCKVDILDIKTKKIIISLNWKQSHKPTQKDISSRRNMYSSNYVDQHGKYYVIHNSFTKKINAPDKYELIIFKENGKLLYKNDFPFELIKTYNKKDNSKIYFVDNNENIAYLDVNQIVE